MKIPVLPALALALTALALMACQSPGVTEVSPGRYRAAQNTFWSAGSSEGGVIAQAQAHCATLGLQASIANEAVQPGAPPSYAGTTAEFTCAPLR